MTTKFPWVFVVLVFPLSCSSVGGVKRNTGQALMYGMVYDNENLPVQNALIYTNGVKVSESDVQGRFVLKSLFRNEFKITVVKPGYEEANAVLQFDPFNIIHIKMINAVQLLSQAESAMDERRWTDAVKLCERALALEENMPEALYLSALAFFRTGDTVTAKTRLMTLQRAVGKKDYIDVLMKELDK
jgi:hypothetical protein